jgi:hypothetical protein
MRVPRLLCHLTFFWLEARPQIFQEAIRVAPSARGGNEMLTGRTLFVGCPFGARPVSSAELGAVTFAFFVCSDPSPSGSESAFRFPELTARFWLFGGIRGRMYGVKQDLTERQSGRRVDRARVMTKLYKMAIQLRDSTRQRVNCHQLVRYCSFQNLMEERPLFPIFCSFNA